MLLVLWEKESLVMSYIGCVQAYALYKKGYSISELAELFEVSENVIQDAFVIAKLNTKA